MPCCNKPDLVESRSRLPMGVLIQVNCLHCGSGDSHWELFVERGKDVPVELFDDEENEE